MNQKLSVYNLTGDKVKEIEVAQKFLLMKPKVSVIHQVVIAQEGNARRMISHVKTKSEVRGGGRKPWKQKGTGRARQGSIRSPLWIGGGVTFGPNRERNFSLKVNKKMKQKALFMCLSDKIASEKMFLLDSLEISSPKTKTMNALFNKLPSGGKKVLVAYTGVNKKLIQSVKNIKKVKTIGVNSLNVIDILRYDYFVTTEEAISKMKEIYSKLNITKEK